MMRTDFHHHRRNCSLRKQTTAKRKFQRVSIGRLELADPEEAEL
jgi:hypothetical protein